jgi:hypothetical protein
MAIQGRIVSVQGRWNGDLRNHERGGEIADAVVAMLTMEDRGFIPELIVWSTNPR